MNQYHIDRYLIEAFLKSMEMDLEKITYTPRLFNAYIYGSAEVVGLMCLKVFCEGQTDLYNSLLPNAQKLGAAFQKINFLRDIRSDYEDKGRVYFPGIDFLCFTEEDKKDIEADIKNDFDAALTGIRGLPHKSRAGVYVAYIYYLDLFYKIKGNPAKTLSSKRIRVSDKRKLWLMAKALFTERVMGI